MNLPRLSTKGSYVPPPNAIKPPTGKASPALACSSEKAEEVDRERGTSEQSVVPRLVRCWVVTRRELFGGQREILGVFDDRDSAAAFLRREDDGIEEFRLESHKIIPANV